MHALGKSSHHPALRPPRAPSAAAPCVRAPPKGWYAMNHASEVQAQPDLPHRVPIIWCVGDQSTATRSTAGRPDGRKARLTSTIGSGPRRDITERDFGRRGGSGAAVYKEVCLGHQSRGERWMPASCKSAKRRLKRRVLVLPAAATGRATALAVTVDVRPLVLSKWTRGPSWTVSKWPF